MVVYVDYMLRPVGRNLEDTPGLIYQMEEPAVKAVIDSQMMHDAPMILREMGGFPYQEGLIFEGELLHKGGKKMAFAGAFVRPPRNSHEVLQPEAYINGDKLPAVRIPDMQTALNHEYDVCDSGGIGELDVRALLKQYGERKIADELSAEWQGGSYVTFRKKDKVVAEISPSTADVALLYVSRWKTPQAAEWFASFYARTVSQRYRTATVQPVPACSGDNCPRLDRTDFYRGRRSDRGALERQQRESYRKASTQRLRPGCASRCAKTAAPFMQNFCRSRRSD